MVAGPGRIPLHNNNPGHVQTHAVSFRDVIQGDANGIGHVAVYDPPHDKNNPTINWRANDEYMNNVSAIRNDIAAAIRSDQPSNDPNIAKLQQLYRDNNWSPEDRVEWERNLSKAVSERMDQVHGLDTYRNDLGTYSDANGRLSNDPNYKPRESTNVNDVSADMKNGTRNMVFDCKSQSATEGSIMQMLENDLLPPNAPAGNMKAAGTYYFVRGDTYDSNDYKAGQTEGGGHAFIVSGVTGNIIEATAENGADPYRKVQGGGNIFDALKNGTPLATVSDNGNVQIYKPGTTSEDMRGVYNNILRQDDVQSAVSDRKNANSAEVAKSMMGDFQGQMNRIAAMTHNNTPVGNIGAVINDCEKIIRNNSALMLPADNQRVAESFAQLRTGISSNLSNYYGRTLEAENGKMSSWNQDGMHPTDPAQYMQWRNTLVQNIEANAQYISPGDMQNIRNSLAKLDTAMAENAQKNGYTFPPAAALTGTGNPAIPSGAPRPQQPAPAQPAPVQQQPAAPATAPPAAPPQPATIAAEVPQAQQPAAPLPKAQAPAAPDPSIVRQPSPAGLEPEPSGFVRGAITTDEPHRIFTDSEGNKTPVDFSPAEFARHITGQTRLAGNSSNSAEILERQEKYIENWTARNGGQLSAEERTLVENAKAEVAAKNAALKANAPATPVAAAAEPPRPQQPAAPPPKAQPPAPAAPPAVDGGKWFAMNSGNALSDITGSEGFAQDAKRWSNAESPEDIARGYAEIMARELGIDPAKVHIIDDKTKPSAEYKPADGSIVVNVSDPNGQRLGLDSVLANTNTMMAASLKAHARSVDFHIDKNINPNLDAIRQNAGMNIQARDVMLYASGDPEAMKYMQAGAREKLDELCKNSPELRQLIDAVHQDCYEGITPGMGARVVTNDGLRASLAQTDPGRAGADFKAGMQQAMAAPAAEVAAATQDQSQGMDKTAPSNFAPA